MRSKKESCFSLIKSDLERIAKPSFKNFLRYYFLPGTTFKYQVWLRIWMDVKKKVIKKFFFGLYSYFRFHRLSYKFGITVNTDITIGKGLRIVHSNGVFINARSIGQNLTIYQNSTIGLNRGGVPTVGNNVIIYANSMVIGNITIGDNCVVSCMSLVNKTTKNDSIMYGIPAIEKEKPNE